MIGIDIGSHSVKAILLDKSSDGYQVMAFAMLPIAKGVVVDHSINDVEATGAVLKNLRKRFPKSVANAAVAVSGSGVITKTIYLSAVQSDDELEAQIEIEADNLIPYPLNEVNLDFEKIKINDSDPGKVDVLLTAARTELVEARVSALEIAQFEARVMDIEGYALGRSYLLIKDQLPESAGEKPIAMIDIGAAMLTVAVIEKGETVFIRELAFGGEQYTQSILSYYGMNYEQAEIAKIGDELPRNYVFEVLAPFQTSMIQQIRRTLQIYSTSNGSDEIAHLVVSGGCAYLDGIETLLSEELRIPTIVAQPFASCFFAEGIVAEQLQKESSKFMVACGLALRSFC
jgi:type IV pilus assembly protein PilM